VASGMIGMRRCLECGCKVWYVQMSPDVVLECRECGRGLADSCITTGHWSYIYCRGTNCRRTPVVDGHYRLAPCARHSSPHSLANLGSAAMLYCCKWYGLGPERKIEGVIMMDDESTEDENDNRTHA